MDGNVPDSSTQPTASNADRANEAGPKELSRAQVERSYRRYAPVYDLLFGASLGPGRMAMTRLVGALAPTHILEVGVGTGLTLAHYPTKAKITGIDVSEDMLASARRRVSEENRSIHLHQMDAEAMEFPDNTFDCVTLPYVLSVTPHPEKLIAEVRRVCRPDGHIVIVNHFSGQRSWRFLEAVLRPLSGWLGFRSEFSLDDNVMRHGWQVLSIEPANFLSLSRLILIRNTCPPVGNENFG
ncbi:MAG: methyltransferase domain-containing protein [Burkholderiaceae bacterium]|nr:methyltransferase domain-containing protein [Burkholderiaceae bacterium]